MNAIKLTRSALGIFRVSPRTADRLLSAFEGAGLVKVDRHRGRCPIVTLLEPPSNTPDD
jgi:hypothetical protein